MRALRARLTMREECCMGCFACEVACKQEHGLPPGPRLIRVRPTEGTPRAGPAAASGNEAAAGGAAGAIGANAAGSGPDVAVGPPWYAIDVCRHCDDPACVAACSTGAVTGDAHRVTVDAVLCTGCQECADACPFGVTWFDPASGTLCLCDLCWSRVTAGLRPACVHHCPADVLALYQPSALGDPDSLVAPTAAAALAGRGAATGDPASDEGGVDR